VLSDVQITKCEITISVCIVEGTDSRASGFWGVFTYAEISGFLEYQLHINLLNAELNPICHLLALLGAYPILHVSRIWVKVIILYL
jgi:hypothetical protein